MATVTKTTATDLEVHTFKLAAPFIHALTECDPELRDVATELFQQLAGELDPAAARATTTLLAEILFPNADHRGAIGLDLEEAEALAPGVNPDAGPVLARMDREEDTFAERLRALLADRGLTQAELAAKVGIGQPAVSMMLNRACRPQRKTVRKIADALGVATADLWPEV